LLGSEGGDRAASTSFLPIMADSAAPATVLIIDDDSEIRYSLQRVLSGRPFRVLSAASGEEGLKVASKEKPQVILLDNRMTGLSGLETLQHLRTSAPKCMVILMTAFGTTQTAIEAMKFGAFDYIIKPFDHKKIVNLVENAARAWTDLYAAGTVYQPLLRSEDYKEGIVGNSEPMQEVFKIIGQVAASDVTVMITGESGTGKELVARCLWQHSHRSNRAFIAVNCAAIPENLIESELFGHEKGSFTGATAQRIGKFELCDGGTIFLDEIGDMTLSTQTKILRAIQQGEIQRVGGSETIKVNVRLIAATNKDLEKLVAGKIFREDLYYRLNVVRIKLPTLRERLSDVPALVDFMLQRLASEKKIRARKVSPEALAALCAYSWPGNVRELENAVYRSGVVAQGETVLIKDLPREIGGSAPGGSAAPWPMVSPKPADAAAKSEAGVSAAAMSPPSAAAPALTLPEAFDLVYRLVRNDTDENILEKIEAAMIERTLKETDGNHAQAASLLGMTRATLKKRVDAMKG
jgi:two-component system nitrogen regulation response regulator GlnG